MELKITQQTIKGGDEVLMVRLGQRQLLSFPLNMRGLANHMIDEALRIDEADGSDLLALVKKYSAKKAEHNDAGTEVAPVQHKRPEPKPTQAAVIAQAVPMPNEVLADLLECARQAEIQMEAASDDLERATNTFSEAERRADLAWQHFNEALIAALPTGSRIIGVRADK